MNRSIRHKNEMRLYVFLQVESARRGVSIETIKEAMRMGLYPGLKIRRAGLRMVFVDDSSVRSRPDVSFPKTGEVSFKQWIMEQCTKAGIGYHGFYTRMLKGKEITPEIRRVNKRVMFVKL